jgi:hypothetical protein
VVLERGTVSKVTLLAEMLLVLNVVPKVAGPQEIVLVESNSGAKLVMVLEGVVVTKVEVVLVVYEVT